MEEKNKGKLSFVEKLGFLLNSTSGNIVFNFKNVYYLIFLTNVLEIPMALAGTMTTIGIIWDAVNDPIVGYMSANMKFKGGETVRPYLKLAAIPWALTTVFLFFDYNLGVNGNFVVGLVIFFVYEIFNTFRNIPYNSMASLASSEDEERKSINSFRSIGACIGSGIGAVAVTPLVKMCGGLKGKDAILGKVDAMPLFYASCLMGVIIIFGSFFHYFTTKERVKGADENEEKLSFVECYKMLFGCKSWVLNMLYVTCYGIGNTLIMSSISYYAAYILGSSSASTPILAAYLVTNIVVSLVTPMVDRKLGRKKTVILAVLIQLIGKIPFIINPFYLPFTYLNAATVAVGGAVAFIMFNTNRNNISDIIELKNGRRIDSMVATGDNLASKVAEASVTTAMTTALAAAGFDVALGANQTAATVDTICALLGWIPAVVSILMFLVVLFLDTKKEQEEVLASKEN